MKQVYILIGVLIATAGLISGLVLLQKRGTEGTTANISAAIAADDHILGTNNAKAFLVEYSDYQCPACAAYWPLLKQLKTDYGDKLSLVYRHFPLRNIHANADASAQAAEAAGLQGKFWEMSDILFSKQQEWSKAANSREIFEGYARDLNLDIEKFKTDFSSEAVKNRVNQSYNEARSLNLPGTPSFFLNGKNITPGSYEEFKSLIEKAMAN